MIVDRLCYYQSVNKQPEKRCTKERLTLMSVRYEYTNLKHFSKFWGQFPSSDINLSCLSKSALDLTKKHQKQYSCFLRSLLCM